MQVIKGEAAARLSVQRRSRVDRLEITTSYFFLVRVESGHIAGDAVLVASLYDVEDGVVRAAAEAKLHNSGGERGH